MKKFRAISLLLCLLLVLQLLPAAVFAATEETGGTTEPTASATAPQIPDGANISNSNNTVAYGCHTPDARYPICGSDEVVQYTDSAILYEVSSDTLVYTYNADDRMHPSSLVKIMTALMTFENCELDEVVRCSKEAIESVPEGALIMYLSEGEILTVEQLLYCMLVGSYNDAAAVLAHHVSGSQEDFVNLMNRRAAELGCRDTIFQNSTGLHHENQVTTARDMARILAVATNYPKFMEIFGTPNYMLEATNMFDSRYLLTTNHMLTDESYLYYKDSRVTGGRTGIMDNGDYCLAVTASIGGGTYIAVTLGTSEYFSLETDQPLSHGSFVDTARVLDVASAAELVNVVDPEQIVTQVSVAGGDYDVVIGSKETVSCVLPAGYDWNMITMRTEFVQNSLQAPVVAGTKVANAQFWYGSVCIGETELFAMIDVPVAAGSQVQVDPGDEGGFDAGALSTAFMVLGVIFALILVLFGGLFLVRTVRIAMRNSRSKKRRQERRRSK